ncbi:MAG: MBL fold metallo-hydrolase [Defluviitaleaceae bacterium]|nr:MBL fold metallo-hydrolase [Defluviitaleaceae bacterium]MCL2262990.1 MBL fold metallo-hydrolase [Defluviitaleaceae bacterium]
MKLKVFGCRGSTAVSRPGSKFGGNTSCITLESEGEMLILDAGSGLMVLQEEYFGQGGIRNKDKAVNILISHLHLDHIVGLGTFSPAWGRDAKARIYTCSRDERPLDEQVFGVFAPPYWPVTMTSSSNAVVTAIEPYVSFNVGVFRITPFVAKHPDKTLSFHVTDGKRNVVHLLDSEVTKMEPSEYDGLLKFCSTADVVIFDACYSQEEYPRYDGWGHSTVEDGIKLAEESNCKKVLFSHYGRHYTDDEIDSWVENLDKNKFLLSYEGMELEV